MCNQRPRNQSTFRGEFLASGNSLSSSRSQRCMNCCTIGFSGLTIWNPEMLAPPAKTLSKLTLENPWVETRGKGKQTTDVPCCNHKILAAILAECTVHFIMNSVLYEKKEHVLAVIVRQMFLYTLCGITRITLQINNLQSDTLESVSDNVEANIFQLNQQAFTKLCHREKKMFLINF